MAKKQTTADNFDLRAFGIGWGICCLVWAIMIWQFWWGNHDWPYIVRGISVYSGLFEARYSQHLPFVFLFDGHLLPVLLAVFSLAALVIEGLFVAHYLEIPKTLGKYLFVALFVGLNPYNFVLFYFVHYMFALAFFGAIGVGMLLFMEKLQSWRKFLFGGLMFFLLLGSYPPNMALILSLYVAKRLKSYCDKKENFIQVCKNGVGFALQLALGFLGFKSVYIYLSTHSYLNMYMYNLTLRSIEEVFSHIFSELGFALLQLFHLRSFMEWSYCILIIILIITAFYIIYRSKVSKLGVTVLVIALLLASRFAFLVSGDSTGFAIFRMEYWSRLGVALFALGILFNQKSKVIKNMLFLWCVICLCMFGKTDFDIQKVQYLGWQAQEKYQVRLKESILEEGMDLNNKYILVAFGYPRFRMKYFSGHVYTGEMVQYPHFFYEEVVNNLFMNDGVIPVVIGVEIKTDILVRHPYKSFIPEWKDEDFWERNPENMKNIRFWLYNKAKGNSVYVDDKYIILVLDTKSFYKKRELIAEKLDE